jgi:predicted dehydrogenase
MGIRTLVVGCGAVAQRLYRKPLLQLVKRDLIEVTGLVDPASEHAREMQTAFPKARHFTGLEDACVALRPELTLVLTPPALHCPQTLTALAHGSHVLCEKPMANSSDECARMNDAAARAQRVLAIGMVRRYFPAFAQLRQLVKSNGVGAVQSFEYREGYKFEWAVTTPAAFRPRSQGGAGVLFDIGTHALDFLASVFGTLTATGYADDAAGGIEANLAMKLRAPDCAGSLDLSWDVPQLNVLRVFGAQGEAALRLDRFDQLAVNTGRGFVAQSIQQSFPVDLAADGRRIVPLSYSDAVLCQLVQVLRAIALGERPAVDGAEGESCIALLEQALGMASPLPEPWLSSREQTAASRLHWSAR